MTAIKSYLLRLILCGLLTGLAGALLQGKRAGRALRLCGGCLLILTALRPLLRVELGKLPDLVTGLTQAQRAEEAKRKNDELLRGLVEEQTAVWIAERAKDLGLLVSASVTTRKTEAGCFVPDAVLLRGSASTAQREALNAVLCRELGLSPEKLRWEGG
ncbi:MAG: hypothetical protein IKI02_03860 [Oscillospiraceae bacterium]|nr:hypothetical protein [Oscillospiraceae bacterium]